MKIKIFVNGFHKHHIIPRSWNFELSNDLNNLLKVPIKAHYIIHHLMYKAFPHDYCMMNAFERMVNTKMQKITAKVYENLMILFIKQSSIRMKNFHQNNPFHIKRQK